MLMYKKIIENLEHERRFPKDQIGDLTKKFKHSLRKRKQLAHQLKNTQDKVEEILEKLEGSLSNESKATISNLMEKNNNQTKQVNSLKKEQ